MLKFHSDPGAKMIKKLLIKVEKLINNLPKELKLSETILSSIKEDINSLASRFDGSKGYINYYSPKVVQQINEKQKLLEKYQNYLTALLAVLICSKQSRDIRDNKKLEPVSEITDLKNLLKHKDVEKIINDITQFDEDQRELKRIERLIQKDEEKEDNKKMHLGKRSKLELRRAELSKRVQLFNNKLKNIPQAEEIKAVLDYCQKYIEKHINLSKQLPKGMLDVKRALSLFDEINSTKTQIRKLSKDKLDSSGQIKLEGLKKELTKAELALQFSYSEEEDKTIKDMLNDLKRLMKMSIRDYQKLATSGGEINVFLHKTTGFYWESLFLYRNVLCEINEYLKKNKKKLSEQGMLVAECISKAFSQMPELDTIEKALEKVKRIDDDLKRQEEYNEKINGTWIRFYKKGPVKFVQQVLEQNLNEKIFYIPYNPHNYVLDHPAQSDFADTLGNCYGETQMFLKQINSKSPAINNICPERVLINYQLDQSRTIAKNTKKEKIGIFEADEKTKAQVTWDGIKDILTSKVTSTAFGDVCMITLTGAQVSGREKLVGHGIGLIKMKNPAPYKYVVYDYAFGGAMGFSSDTQLELFFKQILEGEGSYVPFKKCLVEKVGEVSKECQQLINGSPGIASLTQKSLDKTCNRDFWDKARISFLIKYYPIGTDENRILDLIEKLPQSKDRIELYEQLVKEPKIGIGNLVKCIICSGKISYLANLLTSDLLAVDITNKIKFKLNEQAKKEIVALINNDQIEPNITCKLFSNNQTIVLATYKKDKNSLQYADIDPVVTLLQGKNTITPSDACRAFPKAEKIIIAAYKSDPSSLQFANLGLVQQLLRKGSINLEHASKAFTENSQFKEANEAYQLLKSLKLLPKNEKETEKAKRIELLKSIDQKLEITNLRQELYPLISNMCIRLLDDIRILSPEDTIIKNSRLSKLISSNQCDINTLKTLENKKMELTKTCSLAKSNFTLFGATDNKVDGGNANTCNHITPENK
ncbi:TPA: Dot/Icm T4SS effector PieC/LirE [Legionella pneumophila subsp. pneumophila]|uniref:Dot/Icm T4SS effector PieC/LirE n=1 Tax=Legionella pneumophila TaxID=446 RepID=UPI0009B0993E|nr:Dot/Icm T4SS effector PieC/LirE [Legionella pneumophila]MDW8871168.1 Dot/Icm T4SS effector PieC/LirE [Legionella pneumophila]MDW8917178.1 Dot/Icm T4SS effector PieC/LirE [Legionella pneumophila]MDW9077734.1 Dot/Icm T4SS effector PieC/LirE [Legionella pneumophila]MDW9084107.1 Dot/Icm T4SS effector PieC/LirE [Legionella pneumophila]MDW9107862.1 Dot/Icm T4SS effector PieC/LirE [Legionella pneumophila]